jgi:hypothetical protein
MIRRCAPASAVTVTIAAQASSALAKCELVISNLPGRVIPPALMASQKPGRGDIG